MTEILKQNRLIVFAFFVTAFSIIYNQSIPLYLDEAYYWMWSKHLALSYFDHPPMIAYVLYLFTSVFGDSVFAIRSASLSMLLVAGWFVYKLAYEVFRDKATAELALFIYLIIPIIELGFTISTIDSPLTMFWAGALYYSFRALKSDRWSDYLLLGVFIGAAMLSKYTAVLLVASLLLYLLLLETKKFLSLKFWIAVLVAFVVFSPVIIWNFQNEFISFSFQYTHGTSDEFIIKWAKFFDFLGGQLVVLSPLFFLVAVFMLYKKRKWFRDRDKLFLLINFLFPLLFFLYKALFKKMELNWAAPAYLALIPLLAYFFVEQKYKKTLIIGSTLSILIVLVMKFPLLFGLKDELNFHNRLFGPYEVTEVVKPYMKKDDALFSYHYAFASVLAFYLDKPYSTFVPFPSRFSQFDIWDSKQVWKSKSGIFVDKSDISSRLEKEFKTVKLLKHVELKKDGFLPKTYYIYRVMH
ncbi:MAG: glycosyltransferase family 39 protein [Campylobacterales bacterium]